MDLSRVEMNWRIPVMSSAVVVALAFAVHGMSAIIFWTCLILVVSAMLLNGYLATVEDDWPGGFNKP
jgi:hypothetical protein